MVQIRINACRAFADAEEPKAIAELEWVAEHDLDYRVTRIAEECINFIKESMKAPKEVISIREEVDKLKTNTMEMMQKMNRLERELR